METEAIYYNIFYLIPKCYSSEYFFLNYFISAYKYVKTKKTVGQQTLVVRFNDYAWATIKSTISGPWMLLRRVTEKFFC